MRGRNTEFIAGLSWKPGGCRLSFIVRAYLQTAEWGKIAASAVALHGSTVTGARRCPRPHPETGFCTGWDPIGNGGIESGGAGRMGLREYGYRHLSYPPNTTEMQAWLHFACGVTPWGDLAARVGVKRGTLYSRKGKWGPVCRTLIARRDDAGVPRGTKYGGVDAVSDRDDE